MADNEKLFRFELLDVSPQAADLAVSPGDVADGLTEKHRYRYAEQLQ